MSSILPPEAPQRESPPSKQELLARKERVHQTFSKADAALHAGKISQAERDALLTSYYGTTSERQAVAAIEAQLRTEREPVNRTAIVVSGFSLLMVALFTALLYGTGGITGAVVLDHQVNTTYFADAAVPLELAGATRVNITGALTGQGDVAVLLVTGNDSYTMLNSTSGVQTPHASLPARYYAEGEPVTYDAINVSAAYLMTGAEALPLDNTTIENLTAGEYRIKLIINDTELTQEVLAFTVLPQGTTAPAVSFNTCGQACSVNLTGNATVSISIRGNATLALGSIIVTMQQNSPPELVRAIPDVSAESVARIDVSGAFSDPDGDALIFDVTHHDETEESIEDGILTVSGEPGTRTYIVYASDLGDLTPSNIFSVTLLAAASVNETGTANESMNTSTNITADPALNTTDNSTNSTNITFNGPDVTTNGSAILDAGSCDDPDPNRRPLSCIQSNDSTYFRPEEILLENKEALPVGQLTPVGNLLIKGGLVERSAGQPASNDYALGYQDERGDFVATVWIDSRTGDLHLRGTLTEANGNIPIQEGRSAIANRRGIVLALIDRQTGDLTVRGNLVPYRRTIG